MTPLLTHSLLPYVVGAIIVVVVWSRIAARRRHERETEQARKDERDARLRNGSLETKGVGTGLASYIYSGTEGGVAWRFIPDARGGDSAPRWPGSTRRNS